MPKEKRSWQDELAIIDRTMRAISGITDPEHLVNVYWDNIGDLIGINDFVSLSRRNIDPPYYLVTRSSRFTEELNPWTQRDRLPRLSGGILGEIVYANQPVVIEDLPARLSKDDPAYFYLAANASYDFSESANVFVKVDNLLDKDPPYLSGNTIIRAQAAGGAGYYDQIGRAFTLGVRLKY